MTTERTTIPNDIVGPYTPWPRRRMPVRRKVAAGAALASAAAFVHCVVPML